MKQKKELGKLKLNKQTIAIVSGEDLNKVRGGEWTFNGDCSGGCTEGDFCGKSGSTICKIFKSFSVCMVNDQMEEAR